MSTTAQVAIPLEDGTEVHTTVFQLLQWKHAIGLEMKGMKMSRGSVTAHVRKLLKLPRSAKRELIHQYICECLDDIKEQMGVE